MTADPAISHAIFRPGRRPPAWHAWTLAALKTILFVAISVVIARGAFWLFDRNNNQPAFYHPDEERKVMQLAADERNFNHPQLMLEVAQLWMQWRDVQLTDPDGILAAGRSGSASLAAGAVLLLAWAGFAAAGWTGFACVAVTAGLCPALLAHARYLKEEPALVFGFAAVLCVGAIFCRRRWHWAITLALALLLGVACGLAASGKYAGAVTLAPAVLLTTGKTLRRWWLILPALLLLAAGAYWTWTRINYRALEEWEKFRESFDGELEHSLTDHLGVTMPKPNAYFIDALLADAMPHALWLAALAPIAMLLQRRLPRAPLFIALLGGVYLASLCWSVIPFFRYVLPVTLCLYVLAGMSAAWFVHAMGAPRLVHAAAVLAVVGALAYAQGKRVENYDRQFSDDSRDALRAWVNTNLPPGTRIAADYYTMLDGRFGMPGYTTTAQVYRNRTAANIGGTVRQLRRMGVKYVAVAGPTYERYLDPHTQPDLTPWSVMNYQRTRQFYAELFYGYPVAWSRVEPNKMHVFNSPDITLYRIDEGPVRGQ